MQYQTKKIKNFLQKIGFWCGVLGLLLSLQNVSLHAQNNTDTDDQNTEDDDSSVIDTEAIDIVKEYQPILADAVKIELSPDLPAPIDFEDPRNRPVYNNYIVPNRLINVDFEPPTLKPLAFKPQRNKNEEKMYHAWIRAGYGTQNTPLLDVAFNNGKSEKVNLGFYGNYIGSKGSNIEFQDYNKLDLNAYGKFFAKDNYVNVEAEYDRNTFHEYGYAQIPSDTGMYTAEDLQHIYQNVGANAEIGNSKELKSLADYQFKLGFNRFFDQLEAGENNLIIDGDYFRGLGEEGTVGGTVHAYYSGYENTNVEADTTVSDFMLNLTPKYRWRPFFGEFDLGLSALLDAEEISAFPYIKASVDVVPEKFSIIGGWQKEVVKNNFRNLATTNPFLTNRLAFNNTKKEKRYIGLQAALGKYASLNVKVGQHLAANQPYFVNLANDPKQFEVVYDSLLTTISTQVGVASTFSKDIITGINLIYNSYTPTSELEAWHMPTLNLHFYATYRAIDKLDVSANIFALNGLNAKLGDGAVQEMDGVIDVNLAARYELLENVSLFCNVNNLGSVKFQRYLHYPSYGLNLIGGFMVRF